MKLRVPKQARGALRQALRAIRAEAWADAATALDEVSTIDEASEIDSYETEIVTARCRFLIRDYETALADLERACALRPDHSYAPRLLYSTCRRLGYEQEAHAALELVLQTAPESPTAHQAATLFYESVGEPERALQHLGKVTAAEADGAHWFVLAAKLSADAKLRDATETAARHATELDPETFTDVATSLRRVGAYELLAELASAPATGPAGKAVLAELSLFCLDFERARELARETRMADPDSTSAELTLAACDVLQGELDRAEPALAKLSDKAEAHPAIRVWRAELARRRGDLTLAAAEIQPARNAVPDYLAAKLIVAIVETQLRPDMGLTLDSYEGLLRGQLRAVTGWQAGTGGTSSSVVHAAAVDALAKLGGNLTPYPTSISADGTPSSIEVPCNPRLVALRAQHTILWRGPEHALAEVERVLAKLGPNAVAECYYGELLLWLERSEEAESLFARILAEDDSITWAWIGLAASQIQLDYGELALATIARSEKRLGRRGPTIPVYEGEAYLLLGRYADAVRCLADACASHPNRAAAWCLLAIAQHRLGDVDAFKATVQHLVDSAPGLMSVAQRKAGMPLSRRIETGAEGAVAIAEAALSLLKGNRASSCAFWFAPRTGAIRQLVLSRPVTTPAWERDELRSLVSAIGECIGPPTPDR